MLHPCGHNNSMSTKGRCHTCANIEGYAKNPEKVRRRHRAWYAKSDKSKKRYDHAKKRYGITRTQFEKLKAIGRCEICGCEFDENPHGKHARYIDHCHERGQVRGVLCPACNGALGNFSTIQILQRAIDYLARKELT
jgi:hypothetical protein